MMSWYKNVNFLANPCTFQTCVIPHSYPNHSLCMKMDGWSPTSDAKHWISILVEFCWKSEGNLCSFLHFSFNSISLYLSWAMGCCVTHHSNTATALCAFSALWALGVGMCRVCVCLCSTHAHSRLTLSSTLPLSLCFSISFSLSLLSSVTAVGVYRYFLVIWWIFYGLVMVT